MVIDSERSSQSQFIMSIEIPVQRIKEAAARGYIDNNGVIYRLFKSHLCDCANSGDVNVFLEHNYYHIANAMRILNEITLHRHGDKVYCGFVEGTTLHQLASQKGEEARAQAERIIKSLETNVQETPTCAFVWPFSSELANTIFGDQDIYFSVSNGTITFDTLRLNIDDL